MDREGKKGTCGSHFQLKKKKKKITKQTKQKPIIILHGQKVSEILIFFSFKSSFFNSRVSDRRISSGQT